MRVARPQIGLQVRARPDRAEEAQSRVRMGVDEVRNVEVLLEVHEVPIIEAGATHRVLVDPESEASDEVERGLRRRGETGNVPRVLRDFGLDEDDTERPFERLGAEARAVVLGHRERTSGRTFPRASTQFA